MLPYDGWQTIKPTAIEDLRRPHPEQMRIDAESAALLRATALDVFRRMTPASPGVSLQARATRIVR
jgi:hypothetical protein